MNIIKKTFLKILQNNIVLDDNIIPVVIKDYWYDVTPCITITGFSRDKGKYHREQRTVYQPLPPTHRLYDEEDPNKKYPFLAEYQRKQYEIHINIWCNNEREREEIVNQVRHLLFLARNHHYSYCVNYDKETFKCKKLDDEECRARTSNSFRSLHGHCPTPIKLGYCNIYKSNGVLQNTIHISPDYEADDYNHKPPLKRSIINITLDYFERFIYDSDFLTCFEVEMDASEIDENRILQSLINNEDCHSC